MSEITPERLAEMIAEHENADLHYETEIWHALRELRALRANTPGGVLWAARTAIDEAVGFYRQAASAQDYGGNEWHKFHALADAAICTRGSIDAALSAVKQP